MKHSFRNWLIPALCALAAILSVLLNGCAVKQQDTSVNDAPEADPVEASAAEAEHAGEAVIAYAGTPSLVDIKPDKKVVIDFSATWCGPCRQFAPVFHEIAGRRSADATFYSVDVDAYPQVASAYKVEAIPTVVVIDRDGSVAVRTGYMEAHELEALIDHKN